MGFFSRFRSDIKQGTTDALRLTKGFAKGLTKPVVGLALDNVATFASGIKGKDVKFKALGHEAKPYLSVEKPQQGVDLKRVGGQTVGTALLFSPLKTTKFAAKLASPAQKAITALPVLGKKLAPAAKPAIQASLQAALDAGAGAISSVATDLSSGERDMNKIKKNAKTSAILSAALPIAIGGGSGFFKGVSHQIGQKEGLIKGAKNITEETLAGAGFLNTPQRAIQRTGNLGYQIDKALLKGEVSKNPVIKKLSESARDVTKNWIDDRAPILDNFSNKLRESGASQDDISAAANAQARARITDSRTMKKAFDQSDSFRAIAGTETDPIELMKATDFYTDKLTKLETARKDPSTLIKVQNEFDDFIRNTDPALLEKVKKAHEQTVKAFNAAELADDVKSGLISQEAADAMAAKYPNYSKQVILDYIDNDIAGKNGNSSFKKYVSDAGFRSRLEDARGDLDAMDATQANLLGSMLREKRRAANIEAMTMVDLDIKNGTGVFEPLWTKADTELKDELLGKLSGYKNLKDGIDLAKLSDDNISSLADDIASDAMDKGSIKESLKALRAKEVAAKSDKSIVVFRDGVKEFFKSNDRQIEDYFKGKAVKDTEKWTKAFKLAADWTRKTATQYNPVFTLSNLVIDNQNANAYLPAGVGFTLDDQIESWTIADDFIKTGKASKEIKELYDLGVPLSSFNKSLTKPGVKDIAEIIGGKKSSLNPFTKISEFSEASELSSRLAVIKSAKRAGIKDPDQLRELAKNASIDFSVSGTNLRELNRVVPFLNAAVQGTRNNFKAFAKDPAGFARKMQYSAVLPKLLLDRVNSRYDSYKNLSQKEKDENFIFALGETKDENGNPVLSRITVPRAQGAQLTSQLMDIINDEKTDKRQKAIDIAGAFLRYAPVDRVTGIGGNFSSTLRGLQTNKNYLNYDIVPKGLENEPARAQVLESTSPLIKGTTDLLSKLSGGSREKEGSIELSPIKTEYAVRGFGGGVGSFLLDTVDAAANLAMGKEAQLPGKRRFFKTQTPQSSQEEREESRAIEDADKLRRLNLKTDAKDIDQLIKSTPEEKRGDVIKQLTDQGVMTKEVIDKLKDMNKKKESIGSINPSAPAAVQVRQIDAFLTSAKNDAVRAERLKALEQNNLLTENTVTYLTALKLDQKLLNAKSNEERRAILESIAPSEAVMKALVELKKLDPYLSK